MLNPLKILDPLMLAMKMRDSFRTGDNIHVQNYLQDTLANSLSRSRNINSSNASRSVDTAQLNEHVSRSVNQYLEQMKSMPGTANYSGLQEYIEGIIRQSINQSFGNSLGMPASPLQYKPKGASDTGHESRISEDNEKAEIFEAHDYILVKIQVPQNVYERNLSVRTSSSKVFIKWSPKSHEQVIQLPADVKKEGVKAVIKNHIMELSIPKEENTNSRQVDIDYT